MKNHLRAQYCNQCGKRLTDARAPKDADGRAKLHADIAHPINSECREMIQEVVVSEFFEEIERAKQPGYVSRYDDFDFEYTDAPRSKPAAIRSGRMVSGRTAAHRRGGNVRPIPVECRRTAFSPRRRRAMFGQRAQRTRRPTSAGIFPVNAREFFTQ